MEQFLNLFVAAGLGGFLSATLQHFLGNRRNFLEWLMKERNSSILEFLDAVSASDRADSSNSDEKWHGVLFAATKTKLFVKQETKTAINNFLISAPGSDERTVATKELWEKMGNEANLPPRLF